MSEAKIKTLREIRHHLYDAECDLLEAAFAIRDNFIALEHLDALNEAFAAIRKAKVAITEQYDELQDELLYSGSVEE